jgi:hypothetical protein
VGDRSAETPRFIDVNPVKGELAIEKDVGRESVSVAAEDNAPPGTVTVINP